jgi:hypothetical protein
MAKKKKEMTKEKLKQSGIWIKRISVALLVIGFALNIAGMIIARCGEHLYHDTDKILQVDERLNVEDNLKLAYSRIDRAVYYMSSGNENMQSGLIIIIFGAIGMMASLFIKNGVIDEKGVIDLRKIKKEEKSK